MWRSEIEVLDTGKVNKFRIFHELELLSYAEVVTLWQSNQSFRNFFIDLLKNSEMPSYFWETPPVTIATWNQAFEFVLYNSPSLASLSPEPEAFREHYEKDLDGNGVVAFPNLRGDATLVVPCPVGEDNAYTHVAAFVRKAPEKQVHALWQMVGDMISDVVNDRPTWLSTAGFGVFWLHVRLDTRPKYYRYKPYKQPPA